LTSENARPVTATGALPQRVLGKTGELVPILGLGTACGGMGLDDATAIELYELAIDLGVTYIDTATAYGRAQTQLAHLLQRRRDEVFVATKVNSETAPEAISILEQNLGELGIDRVDLTYVHAVGGKDIDRLLAADGALAGLREARDRGLTRYLGFTSHNSPGRSARLLRETEVDVVMFALNSGDRHTYDFEGKVLPLANAQNAGIAAMKVYGGATKMKYHKPVHSHLSNHGAHDHQLALRYALDLPGVATAVVGMFDTDELRKNVQWARSYTPLTTPERELLEGLGRRLAADWGPHFGPVE